MVPALNTFAFGEQNGALRFPGHACILAPSDAISCGVRSAFQEVHVLPSEMTFERCDDGENANAHVQEEAKRSVKELKKDAYEDTAALVAQIETMAPLCSARRETRIYVAEESINRFTDPGSSCFRL